MINNGYSNDMTLKNMLGIIIICKGIKITNAKVINPVQNNFQMESIDQIDSQILQRNKVASNQCLKLLYNYTIRQFFIVCSTLSSFNRCLVFFMWVLPAIAISLDYWSTSFEDLPVAKRNEYALKIFQGIIGSFALIVHYSIKAWKKFHLKNKLKRYKRKLGSLLSKHNYDKMNSTNIKK